MSVVLQSDNPTLVLKAEKDGKIRLRSATVSEAKIVFVGERIQCTWDAGRVQVEVVKIPKPVSREEVEEVLLSVLGDDASNPILILNPAPAIAAVFALFERSPA